MSKIIGNTTATPMAIPDWEQTNPRMADYIKNKPDFDGLSEQVKNIDDKVGDVSVSEQIESAILNLENLVYVSEENQESAVVPLNADTLQGYDAASFRLNTWVPTAAEVGAAPAGFGYGEDLRISLWSDTDGTQLEASLDSFFASVDKLDKVYRFKLVDYPACEVSGQGGFADVMCSDMSDGTPRDIVIVFYGLQGGIAIATKKKHGGVWYPWEYVNPPMELGVEYRTTERCGGSPVYAQRLSVGSFPETSGSNIDINTGIEVGSIVRLSANIGQWSMPYLNRQIVGTGYYTDPKDGKIKITIMLYTNISRDLGGSVDVTLYYTK